MMINERFVAKIANNYFLWKNVDGTKEAGSRVATLVKGEDFNKVLHTIKEMMNARTNVQ